MRSQPITLAILSLLCITPALVRGDVGATLTEEQIKETMREPKELAAKIDEYIAATWKAKGVKPSAKADDREFLRRLFLDLGGRIPKTGEAIDCVDSFFPGQRR